MAVRKAQMLRYLSNSPLPDYRQVDESRQRSVTFASSTKGNAW